MNKRRASSKSVSWTPSPKQTSPRTAASTLQRAVRQRQKKRTAAASTLQSAVRQRQKNYEWVENIIHRHDFPVQFAYFHPNSAQNQAQNARKIMEYYNLNPNKRNEAVNIVTQAPLNLKEGQRIKRLAGRKYAGHPAPHWPSSPRAVAVANYRPFGAGHSPLERDQRRWLQRMLTLARAAGAWQRALRNALDLGST